MAALTLEQAITPSRAGVKPSAKKVAKGKGKKGDQEIILPDFVCPPAKNAQETRELLRMSQRMEGFHGYFRQSFKQLYELADGSFAKHGLNVRDFMDVGEGLLRHLEGHHSIEERHIFPILAKRMPQFAEEHQEEHDAIHEGMHKFEVLLEKYRADPTSYSPDVFREHLSSWGPVLFYHLNAEVESLKPDVLRRYWTLDEIKRLPM